MDVTPVAAPLPAPAVFSVGSGSTAVAEALAGATGGRRLVEVSADALAVPDAAVAETLPVVLVVSGEEASRLDELLSLQEAAQSARRRVRVSLVILLPCSKMTREALDEALDGDGRPLVDAVMFVSAASPQAAATSIEAWLRLRHDAPSAAFGDLRDSSGRSCRYATVTAMALTAAPRPVELPASVGGEQRAQHAVDQSRAELAAHVAEAGTGRCEALPGDQLDELAAKATEQLLARLDGCVATTLTSAAELLDSEPVVVDDVAVTDARLALARDTAALDAETSRTGLTAKIGRRRRLEPLTAAVESSRAALVSAVAVADQAGAMKALRTQGVAALVSEAEAAAASDRATSASALASAREAWLHGTIEQAAGLELPVRIEVDRIGRAWSGATPAVRRYVALPTDSTLDTEQLPAGAIRAGGAAGVAVLTVEGLDRPLAAALLLGFPVGAIVES